MEISGVGAGGVSFVLHGLPSLPPSQLVLRHASSPFGPFFRVHGAGLRVLYLGKGQRIGGGPRLLDSGHGVEHSGDGIFAYYISGRCIFLGASGLGRFPSSSRYESIFVCTSTF